MTSRFTIRALPEGTPDTEQSIRISSPDLEITMRGKDASKMIDSMLGRFQTDLKANLSRPDIKREIIKAKR